MEFPVRASGGHGIWIAVFRGFMATVALAISAAFVVRELGDTDTTAVLAALSTVPFTAWLLAAAASIASFLAVGQYDAQVHSWLRTGVRRRRSMVSGAASIAIAQTLGFGLVTGTLARWRTLPEITLAEAFKVTNYVSLSFMASLGVLSAVAATLSGPNMPGIEIFTGLAVMVSLTLCALSFMPEGRLPFAVPPLRLMGRLVIIAAADTALAALALWSFLPSETAVEFHHVFAALLVGLAAGFLSGTPGGIGVFEACFVLLLPDIPTPDLLASVLAFRTIYYALPACLAILVLARPGEGTREQVKPGSRDPAWRAEAGLADLPGHGISALARTPVLTARAGGSLVVIGDGLEGRPFRSEELAALSRDARRQGLWPALYKAGARSALAARRQGWRAVAISEDAYVIPVEFSTAGTKMRQLRRKLRQAQAAQISIERPGRLPLEEMARVSHAWVKRSGGERGFSMGRFTTEYIENQRTYLAWRDQRLVAFITLHVGNREWALDLMRSIDDAPSGVMHALLVRAIEDAARHGLDRVSLAAMRLERPAGLLAVLSRRGKADGLRRFKQCFAPHTSRRYLIAPNLALLGLSGAGILISICFPEYISPTSGRAQRRKSHALRSMPHCSKKPCPALTSGPS